MASAPSVRSEGLGLGRVGFRVCWGLLGLGFWSLGFRAFRECRV